uniref:Uncharacterized protein n=1 Tax=Junco hyemalis TaxID=40217 RepID=A0A8C5NSM8_JUNHY
MVFEMCQDCPGEIGLGSWQGIAGWAGIPRFAVAAPGSLAVPKARLDIGAGAAWHGGRLAEGWKGPWGPFHQPFPNSSAAPAQLCSPHSSELLQPLLPSPVPAVLPFLQEPWRAELLPSLAPPAPSVQPHLLCSRTCLRHKLCFWFCSWTSDTNCAFCSALRPL